MVLVLKMAMFPTFFFRQIRPGKCVLRYFRTKNGFLGNKNKKFKQSKNWCFLRGLTDRFWTIMAFVATSFFLSKIGQENVFYDILKRKNPFLGYQKRRSKSRKIGIIRKRLTHGFGPKMAIFPTSFF